MAVKFGMTVVEIIGQLTRGFMKAMGRKPDGLEKIKIQQEAVQRFKDMNKVVDLEGNVIDTSKGIMGGKQIQDSPEFGAGIRETYDKAKGPGKGQEMVDALKSPGAKKSYEIIEDQLGVKLYGDETFDEILEIQKTGKHPRGEPKIRNKKIVKDAIDNVSPGFVKGDRKYNAQLVAEDLADKKFGKDFYDLDQKQQNDLYGEALDGLSVDLEDFATGGRAGFFMGSLFPKGLATLRSMLNFMGKKSDKVKNPSDVLKMVNPKSLNALLEDPRLQGKVNIKEGILASDSVKGFQSEMGEDRIQLVKDMLSAAKNIKRSDDKILAYKNDVKERFMKDLQMSEADAEIAADRMATLAMDITKMEKTPKITEEGLLQLENVLKNMETGGKKSRDLNADGGRAGFSNGGIDVLKLEDEALQRAINAFKYYQSTGGKKNFRDYLRESGRFGDQFRAEGGRIGFKDGPGMTRRTFLKLLGGLATIPIVGKILKPLKLATGVKKVPIIKTDNVAGKPEWFDQLVNKVIIEGDDVTKRFATGERQSIHQKTLDDGSVVRVTEDVDDGAVRVEYQSEQNVFGDDVMLQYKKPLPDEGDPNPAAQFDVAESGPVGRSVGPDDFEIDVDEVGGQSIRDLDSDVSKLKEYATGKKPTMREIVQNKKRRDRAAAITDDIDGAASDAVVRRQGDYDPSDYDDGMASGGIARMLGE